MTLIVCLLGKDAIVTASDSRAYFKDEKEVTCHDDTNKKIHLIHNVAICDEGTTHTKMFVDEIKKKPVTGIEEIAKEMTKVANDFPLFAAPNEHFTKVNPDFVRARLELAIVGYIGKEPRIYTLNSTIRFASIPYYDSFALSGAIKGGSAASSTKRFCFIGIDPFFLMIIVKV